MLVTFQPRAIPATPPTHVGMLQDLNHTQEMPSEADIHLWTHRDDNEDDATVHAMIDALEDAKETQEEYEEGQHLYWTVTGQLDP